MAQIFAGVVFAVAAYMLVGKGLALRVRSCPAG
jgi:hypothetical protein